MVWSWFNSRASECMRQYGFPRSWLYCSGPHGVVDEWEPIYSSSSKSCSLCFQISHRFFFLEKQFRCCCCRSMETLVGLLYHVTEQKVGNVCVCVVTEFTSSCIFRNANPAVVWFLRRKMSHKVNVQRYGVLQLMSLT